MIVSCAVRRSAVSSGGALAQREEPLPHPLSRRGDCAPEILLWSWLSIGVRESGVRARWREWAGVCCEPRDVQTEPKRGRRRAAGLPAKRSKPRMIVGRLQAFGRLTHSVKMKVSDL